ncbi:MULTISPECIES: ATP-binding response regulator [Roseomonadaceae]|uniref:histidine kinase n=1 Tax=Falsiroseomonas oleicola TaxID=2801474 RepID=A0ABS6HBN6_9PROT|nr:HAMP domain-containing sensor histidine kinase [Roseomonas oleicola]MBU8544735.1 response regulator [Roseomonas oleicola]
MQPGRAQLLLLLIPAVAGIGVAVLVVAGVVARPVPALVALVLVQALAAVLVVLLRRRVAAPDDADRRAEAEARRRVEVLRRDMLAIAAHEVRTPLGGIVGLLDLVLEQPGLNQAGRLDAAAARQAAADLMVVLRDLIEVPGAAPQPLADQPFRVDALMAEVAALLRARATQQGDRLSVAVAAGTHPTWRGDPPRIRQILINMVVNAIRFTEGGEVRIEARETAAGALELRVSDTGRGIAPDRLDALFQRFQDSDGGTGLGLSICRDLAARMGGGIEVQSAPGHGSGFTVTLPLRQATESEMPPPPPPPTTPAAPRSAPPKPGLPVLVVDDVAVNRRLLTTLLDRAGLAHEQAGDAEAALALLRARPFAAVLMDLEMPGVDGLAATRLLRALPGPAGRLPVLAVTAHDDPATRAAARAAGMDGYLVKPVALAELVAALDAASRDRSSGLQPPHG